MGSLTALFDPERVAVVGATERTGSVGRAITANLLADFDGEVVPVNPGRDAVLGTPAVDAVGDADADLAVVVVPPDVAVDVVRAAGAAGVTAVVVITAGFGETGPEGAARERELRAAAEEYDIDLVGPNSLGVMATGNGLNATFGPDNALPGSISFMSQSGAFVTAALDWANDRGIGFNHVVSLGNEAVLDETDFVRAWGDDPDTDVIVGYLEGIESGRAFVDAAREVTADTPIVLVKSGRTDAGAQAASSHTGTLAGSEAAYEAGLEQAGVIRAESVGKLFDAARMLANQPLPDGDGVAVITNAGGPGVMATDAVGDSSLRMAEFAPETVADLESLLPPEGNAHNPVDVVGDADVERFRAALSTTLDDDAVDAALVLSAPTAVLEAEELAGAVEALRADNETPIAASFMGGSRVEDAEARLREVGIPNYFDPARAIDSLDVLARYRRVRDRTYDGATAFDDVDRERAQEILSVVRERGDNRLGVEAMGLLEAYGIPTPRGEVVDSPTAAVDTAESIGDDVVMKIVSPDILHKSDIGGVEVGVAPEQVAETYEELVTRARSYQPDADILGVQVQAPVDIDAGVETIVGANRDPQFGPLVLFGLGGVYVEILEDTSSRVAPVSASEAAAMVDEIDAAALLRGARGRDPVDVDAVRETIGRLSQLVTDFPAILELDVNPLVVTPDGATAVDVRLTVDPDTLDQ